MPHMPKVAKEKAPSASRRKPVAKKRAATATKPRTTARKAPTRTPPEPARRRGDGDGSWKLLASLIVAVVVIMGTSVAIGMTDGGVINVQNTMSKRVAEQQASGDTEALEKAKAAARTAPKPGVPNGGLVGSGNQNTEQQLAQAAAAGISSSTASTTASTTDATASSTDETGEATEEETEVPEVAGEGDETVTDATETTGSETTE